MQKSEKNGPCRLFRTSRRVYTASILQEILVLIFDENEILSHEEMCNRLGQFLSQKNFSKRGESKRARAALLQRNLVSYERKNQSYCLTSEGLQFAQKIKYKSFLSTNKSDSSFPQRPSRKRKKDAEFQNNSRFQEIPGYDAKVILRSLFEHDIATEFHPDKLQRWIYDLMCTEWHTIKSCANVDSDPPRQRQAVVMFNKMLKSGLLKKEIHGNFEVIILTEKGAIYSELQTERQIFRTGKREKYEKIARVIPLGQGVRARGLRKLKKFSNHML